MTEVELLRMSTRFVALSHLHSDTPLEPTAETVEILLDLGNLPPVVIDQAGARLIVGYEFLVCAVALSWPKLLVLSFVSEPGEFRVEAGLAAIDWKPEADLLRLLRQTIHLAERSIEAEAFDWCEAA